MRLPRIRMARPTLPTAIALLALAVATTGTAAAATGQLVNIADGTNAARLAKVNTAGQVSVGDGSGYMTVDGTVNARTAAPATPFNHQGIAFQDGVYTNLLPATTGTLAITGLRIANATANPSSVNIYQYPGTSSGCSSTSGAIRSVLGQYHVPAGQTLMEPLTTPVVVKPPATGGGWWCLATFASGTTGQGMYVQVNGYVVSGTFSGASAKSPLNAQPGTAAAPTRRTS